MLTQAEVKNAVKNKTTVVGGAIDGRDFARLTDFFPVEDWPIFGFELKDGSTAPAQQKPWTVDAVLAELKADLEFAFEKALDKRGISASCMWAVVLMWMWVLEDPLYEQHNDGYEYAQYGLPLLKAVAVKYGLPNPIGDDLGTERKYSSDY